MIQNKEVLEQIREEAVKELNSYDCRILVCSGTGCVATGSQKIYEKFLEIAKDAPGVSIEFGPHDKDAHVGVKKTGCQGVCELTHTRRGSRLRTVRPERQTGKGARRDRTERRRWKTDRGRSVGKRNGPQGRKV